LPFDTFFPSDTFVTDTHSYRKMASDIAQKAIGQAFNQKSIGRDGGYAIVIFVSPESIKENEQVSPGGAVFVTGSAGKKVDTNTQ